MHPIKEVKGLFQLDVFENKSYGMVNTMILACDVTQTKQIHVDIMGLRGYEFEDAKDYAGKIGTLFCDLLIYLRVWDIMSNVRVVYFNLYLILNQQHSRICLRIMIILYLRCLNFNVLKKDTWGLGNFVSL